MKKEEIYHYRKNATLFSSEMEIIFENDPVLKYRGQEKEIDQYVHALNHAYHIGKQDINLQQDENTVSILMQKPFSFEIQEKNIFAIHLKNEKLMVMTSTEKEISYLVSALNGAYILGASQQVASDQDNADIKIKPVVVTM